MNKVKNIFNNIIQRYSFLTYLILSFISFSILLIDTSNSDKNELYAYVLAVFAIVKYFIFFILLFKETLTPTFRIPKKIQQNLIFKFLIIFSTIYLPITSIIECAIYKEELSFIPWSFLIIFVLWIAYIKEGNIKFRNFVANTVNRHSFATYTALSIPFFAIIIGFCAITQSIDTIIIGIGILIGIFSITIIKYILLIILLIKERKKPSFRISQKTMNHWSFQLIIITSFILTLFEFFIENITIGFLLYAIIFNHGL